MNAGEFIDWRQLYQTALDQLKEAPLDLPKGDKRETIEKRVKTVENALARADAKLAKELGMKLCDCTWPPQIMRRQGDIHVCPACNRQIGLPQQTRTNTRPRWAAYR